jgi:hypothetical protein
MLPSIICWHIWLERNKVLFEEGHKTSIAGVIYRILGWLGKSKKKLHPTTKKNLPPKILLRRPIGWFDGVAQRNGQLSGAGGVIRINSQTRYRWMLNCGPGTNTRAELLGVWALLSLAICLHIYDLQVVGDSKIVIDWLNKTSDIQVLGLTFWKERIEALIPEFSALDFMHSYRDFNRRQMYFPNKLWNYRKGT